MDKQSLFEMLADNQPGELFDALKSKQGYYKDLVLLESQWKLNPSPSSLGYA